MVHKKYTYKDGKRFGPYYYQTKRVDGRVVTTYLGTRLPKRNNIQNFIVVISFLLLISSVYFISSNITGNATLDIDTNYKFGEQITGNLELRVLEGELVPADSIVIVSYGNLSREFVLSDLILNDKLEGEFYIEDASISGKGLGYGVVGTKVEYPQVDFEFYVEEEEESGSSSPSLSEEQPVEETPTEESSQTNEEVENVEESSEEAQAEQQTEIESSGITGAVISGSSIISGSVSKESDFSYDLNEGDIASLVSGSVYDGDNQLDDGAVKFNSNKKKVTVTTDYSVEIEGFGPDYIGKGSASLDIDVGSFGLTADNEDEIDMMLVYDGVLIAEASDRISISNIPESAENSESEAETETSSSNDTLVNETQAGNVTEFNQTISNGTSFNETFVNGTVINITESNYTVNVNTVQYGAVIGQPVKWVKTVSLDLNDSVNLTIEIPASAENVTINKITDQEVKEAEISEFTESDILVSINGEVISDSGLKRESFIDKILKLFRFTGRAIEEETEIQEISVEVLEEDAAVEVEYYTAAPTAVEKVIDDKFKTVFVSSPDDVHYENVLVFTEVTDSLAKSPSDLLIEWVENDSALDVSYYNDTNSDGYIDYVEWIAPHLSNQTFNIIVILDALHLDENRGFISNIYNETRELDGVWSEAIPDGHYVRVTFEINLTNVNDITIYPRIISGAPIIEVYERDGIEVIALFENITNESYNKIYLTSLGNRTQDTFDLKIIGGGLEFDHIIDPTAQPGGTKELRAQTCGAMSNGASQWQYNDACTGTYPSACPGDAVSCDDGTTEDTTMNNGEYSGINITTFNSSIVNCQSINQVFLCYEWWNDLSTGLTACPIYVDANGGASPTDIGPACPGKIANPGRSCVNVTSLETWTCSNFFGSTGTRARAITEVLNDVEDSILTLSHDALFFNVTYTESNSPNVFGLNSPANGSTTTARSVNISLGINDTDWINGTAGYLSAFVDTDSTFSYENMIYGPVNFTTNGTFTFNYSIPPLKYNSTQGMFLLYHFDNNTIFGDNLTRVVDYATGAFNGTTSNVNGGRELSRPGLGMAYEVDSNERISLVDTALLDSPNVTGEITLMAWINLSTNVTNDSNQFFALIGKQSSAANRDYLLDFSNSSKRMTFSTGNGTSTPVFFTSNAIILPNSSWYHVAVTYNRGTGNTTFYINGDVDKSQNLTHKNTLIDTTAGLTIGGSNANNYFPGLIDDVAVFNKTLTAAEILDIYRLREGVYHWRVNVSDNAGAYNVSQVYTFTIGNNVPYNGTNVFINSSLGTNRTSENLNLRTTLLDIEGELMNVTVRWYINHTVQQVVSQFNNSYSNGTTFIATLGHLNTSKNENWTGMLTISDGRNYFYVNSSTLPIVDSPPNVTLLTPANNSISPNYTTQNFTWSMADDDPPEYISVIQINWSSLAAYSGCDDPLYNGSITYPFLDNRTSYAIADAGAKFECPSYLWSVQAQGTVLGPYAPYFRINFTGVEPNVTLNAPANSTNHTYGNSISFNWTANDMGAANMTCNLTIGSVVNRSNIASPNLTMVNVSVNNFLSGNYNWNVTCLDRYGNRGNSTTRTFTVLSSIYNGTALIINSTLGLNKTLEDLNVRTTLLNLNNKSMNVTVRWYNNSFLAVTTQYNNSYTNGSIFIATLDDRNTTKIQNWSAALTIHDGLSTFSVNSSNITILNSLPNVTLLTPSNGSITLNRSTQYFTWAMSDDDGDGIVQDRINISLVASSTCTDPHFDGTDIYEPFETPGQYSFGLNNAHSFRCLIDNGDYYRWSVAASDDTGYGSYAGPFNLSVQAYLDIRMNISSIEFGNLGYLRNNDTSDNSPKPIIMVNEGNVLNNVEVKASSIWRSLAATSDKYRIKVDNVTTNGISENGSFLWSGSQTTYENIPVDAFEDTLPIITDLNYTAATDSAEIDINVTVPAAEGPGYKNSTITFTIILGSGDTY